MAQLINITSEALQATVRRLLPSQQGFGEDLQASNVIQPILDLTPTAEGSQIPQNLSQALSYGAITSTTVAGGGAPVTVCQGTGFFRLFGVSNARFNSASNYENRLEFYNGSSYKLILLHSLPAGSSELGESLSFDFIVYLRPGGNDTVTATSNSSAGPVQTASWQIADSNGNLVQPSGFSPE